MTAELLSGKAIAAEIRDELRVEIEQMKNRGVIPGLAVILVGDNPASVSYVTAKEKACEEIGIYSEEHRLPADASEEELVALIQDLNQKKEIHGILVQLPLPKHIDEKRILNLIVPEKDVDGFHPVSVGKMLIGEETFLPCTPHGILQILKRSHVETEGAHVVVVGRSNIVGKPVAAMLMQKANPGNATVTVCHTATKELETYTRQADILIVASGRPNTVDAKMVKPGAVVIDVGVNRIEDATRKQGFRLVGDVAEDVKEVASKLTPVPGGVGPMTITMLLWNTVRSAANFENNGQK